MYRKYKKRQKQMDTSNTNQENESHTSQLEDAWQTFRKEYIPANVEASIVSHMRLIFYVGAIYMFDFSMTALFGSKEGFEKFYVDIRDEIDTFRNQLAAENEAEKRKVKVN